MSRKEEKKTDLEAENAELREMAGLDDEGE